MLTGHRRLVVSAMIMALLLIVTSCSDAGPSLREGPTPTPLPPPPVPDLTTYVVQRGTVIDAVEFSGRVSPVVEEELYFRVGGRVKAVYVQRDDYVEAGTLLAELENDDLIRQLEQHKLDLMNAETNLRDAMARQEYDVARAEINLQMKQLQLQKMLASTDNPDLTIALANLQKAEAAVQAAQAAYDRRASQPGVEASPEALNLQRATIDLEIAQASYQKALAGQKTAQYDIEMQRLQVKLAELELEHLRTEIDPKLVNAVERARLAVERVEDQLNQTRVITPISGKVTAAAPSVGSTVQAYRPLFIVADESELEITADLQDATLSRLTEGLQVTIEFNQYPGQEFTGTIVQLPYPYGSGGGTEVEERETATRIGYEAPGLELKPGNIANMRAVLAVKEDVLWLPPIAVRDVSGRRFVIVEEGGRQRRVDVKVGIQGPDRVEIVEGLEEGQRVLVT